MLNKIESVVSFWIESQDIEPLENLVLNYWPIWFVSHVNTMDKITARFLIMNGFSEAQHHE